MRVIACAAIFAPLLAGCGFWDGDHINTKSKFSSSEYGVKASPRVFKGKNVPKGGGRFQVGKPYKVAGRWYTPEDDPHYDNTGLASWYGPNFHGRQTANGEYFDQYALTAAHPTLPLPSYVRVTNLENGRSVMVRVNDRGPFAHGREIDLSKRTAELLDFINKGTTRVRVKYVGRAPLEGDDTKMLMASLNTPTRMETSRTDNIRIAFNETPTPVAAVPRPSARGPISVSPEGFNIVVSSSDGLGPIFYASPAFDADAADERVESAITAANAMATRPGALEAWRQSIDEDARSIRLELGVFSQSERVSAVLDSFTILGAVDVEDVTLQGQSATRLTLTHLKPGVTRQDIVERVEALGLNRAIVY